MRVRTLLTAALVLFGTAVCWRLGFWQISRLHQKQRMNAALEAALQAPPVPVAGGVPPADSVRDHRVSLEGRYDESRQILLSARTRGGAPGVDVVTPLRLAGDSVAVLVDRGWLFARDAARARPQDYPQPGARTVVGLAHTLEHGRGGLPVFALERDSVTLYSARWLDADTLASRFPYALAGFYVRELPGPGVPDKPLRVPPERYDESMHVNYAIQWFLFGAILLGGSVAVVLTRRRKRTFEVPPAPR